MWTRSKTDGFQPAASTVLCTAHWLVPTAQHHITGLRCLRFSQFWRTRRVRHGGLRAHEARSFRQAALAVMVTPRAGRTTGRVERGLNRANGQNGRACTRRTITEKMAAVITTLQCNSYEECHFRPKRLSATQHTTFSLYLLSGSQLARRALDDDHC